jgi:hypothetical protein
MPDLVCFGVGGTGAACVEATLHLAALGLFKDCRLTVCVIDADLPHPRSVKADQFARRYNELRRLGKAPEGWREGLFGTPIDWLGGARKPSGENNLFNLLGLTDSAASAVARLFFTADETGRGSVFRNGYYGRTNAGVCFFSDGHIRENILTPLHPSLKGARVVVFGSNFGGTGAAGMLDLARALRSIPAFTAAELPKIALVQLEPYFRPDDSHLTVEEKSQTLINDPRTFERRAATSYQFLDMLQQASNLPFDAFYPLGTPAPAKFPADAAWFKADSQDNPPLFPEYLAALAAADFLGREAASIPVSRKRQVALAPFGKPLDRLRELLFATTFSQMILESYAIPLVQKARERRTLPGHPWIGDLIEESSTTVDDLFDHLSRSEGLLREILTRIGVREGGPEQRQKREITLNSFPDKFLAQAEHVKLTESIATGNPVKLFDDYSLATDGGLPVRALFRWVRAAQRVPDAAEPGKTHEPREHQLCQQERQPGQRALGLPVATDDEFNDLDPAVNLLARLAGANWDRPKDLASRIEWELPTVWATALAHRERLYGRSLSGEDLRRLEYLHIGLLWQALMKIEGRSFAPVYAFAVSVPPSRSSDAASDEDARDEVSQGLPAVFREAVQRTCPLGQQTYAKAVDSRWRILAIYDDSTPYSPTGNEHPPADKVIGFLYPDTVVVPAAGLAETQRDRLTSLGRYVAEQGFASFLLSQVCRNWPATLQASGVPHGKEVGQDFIDLLTRLAKGKPVRGIGPDDREEMPAIADVSSWIFSLYREA